jgi:hypothetical protein
MTARQRARAILTILATVGLVAGTVSLAAPAQAGAAQSLPRHASRAAKSAHIKVAFRPPASHASAERLKIGAIARVSEAFEGMEHMRPWDRRVIIYGDERKIEITRMPNGDFQEELTARQGDLVRNGPTYTVITGPRRLVSILTYSAQELLRRGAELDHAWALPQGPPSRLRLALLGPRTQLMAFYYPGSYYPGS